MMNFVLLITCIFTSYMMMGSGLLICEFALICENSVFYCLSLNRNRKLCNVCGFLFPSELGLPLLSSLLMASDQTLHNREVVNNLLCIRVIVSWPQ